MMAVRELVLVLGLLVSAHCEVRARDPEAEEDQHESGATVGGGGGAASPPILEGLHPRASETSPSGDGGNHPARTGNWCAFVQKRVVTVAVKCGTEKYTIRSQSPCPSGKSDCQLVMYKLSTRPVYEQRQQISSALLWRCCPGHGGFNCEDSVSGAQLDSGSPALIGGSDNVRTELLAPGLQQRLKQQRADPNREQSDHQVPYDAGYHGDQQSTTPPAPEPDRRRNPDAHHPHPPHHEPNPPHHQPNPPHHEPNPPHHEPNPPHHQPHPPHHQPNPPHHQPNPPHYEPNPPHHEPNPPHHEPNPPHHEPNPPHHQPNPPHHEPNPPHHQPNPPHHQPNPPHHEPNPPHHQPNPPHHEPNPPHHQPNPPHHQPNPPHHQPNPPHHQPNPPHHEPNPPHHQPNPPHHQPNPPHHQPNPPHHEPNPPHHEPNPPHHQPNPPHHQPNPPHHQPNPPHHQPHPPHHQPNPPHHQPNPPHHQPHPPHHQPNPPHHQPNPPHHQPHPPHHQPNPPHYEPHPPHHQPNPPHYEPHPPHHQPNPPPQRPHPAQQHQLQEHRPAVDEVDAEPLLYPEAPAPLPAPHMMALVMSQLQPVLQAFNRSLQQLSRQVGDLALDVARLKGGGLEEQMQSGPPARRELDEAAEQRLNAKLDEVFQHLGEVQRQMESQRTDTVNRLHSQHAMLHYNLTSFKTDMDMKLKRQQKMLQVSLQAMNATLSEVKLDQDQLAEDRRPPTPLLPPHPPLQPPPTSALWEAIERLDNVVVNNTVKVDVLMEDLEVNSGDVEQLRRDVKVLEKHINGTARTSQIQFMETGLEVEAAREAVLRRVGELAGNLSRQGERLQEMDVDVDYLYEAFYKQNSSAGCDCNGLKAAIAQLGRGVANVTELANDNRLALEEESEEVARQWGGAGDWEPAVEALQYGLQQVKEALASEHNRTKSLGHSLALLSSSATAALSDLSGLKQADKKLVEEMQHLSGSFKSLLTDTIRHSDVLELMLGEEVLDFLEWSVQDQEAHSVPALKEQLRLLQEQLSITSLQSNQPGGREEVPSADQPSSSSPSHPLSDDWLPGSTRRNSGGVPARERQLLLRPEHGGDGSDLWNLEKAVEQLKLKVLLLEEKSFNTSNQREAEAKLQAEVVWLKRGLEEHLRVFKNVFSNADALAGSDATLELDKLWQLVKNRDGKKEKKGGGGGGRGRGGNLRSRRDTSGVAPGPLSQSGAPLLLVAGSPARVLDSVVVFEASLNRGHFYSAAGTFAAPLAGTYLFVLTLDLSPGRGHVVLRRGSGAPPLILHRREAWAGGPATDVGLLRLRRGEEVRLEVKGALRTAVRTRSEDNVLIALLLHRTV
ncbi:multimerin-2a [Spinachia spinachia]